MCTCLAEHSVTPACIGSTLLGDLQSRYLENQVVLTWNDIADVVPTRSVAVYQTGVKAQRCRLHLSQHAWFPWEVLLVPVEFGHVRSSSSRGRAGTRAGPFPEECLVEAEEDSVPPQLLRLTCLTFQDALPGFLMGSSCGASHSGVTAAMALAHQVLCFDCSSTEMSMASQ